MSTILTGLYTSPSAASSAVHTLEARGVPTADISVVAAEGTKRESFGIEGKTKAAEGAAVGAGTGGAIGALVAGFTMVGALATGGIGLLAAGPLVAALAGAGAGAAAGGTIGTLVGLALPQNEIKFYDDALRKGSVLVGVNCDDADRKALVSEIFKTSGAAKVSHA